MQHTYNRLSLLQNLKHPEVFREFCVVIAPEHWGRHLINISLLLRASSLSVETECGSRRCTVSLDYPLGTDTVDWHWCREEETSNSYALSSSHLDLTSFSLAGSLCFCPSFSYWWGDRFWHASTVKARHTPRYFTRTCGGLSTIGKNVASYVKPPFLLSTRSKTCQQLQHLSAQFNMVQAE